MTEDNAIEYLKKIQADLDNELKNLNRGNIVYGTTGGMDSYKMEFINFNEDVPPLVPTNFNGSLSKFEFDDGSVIHTDGGVEAAHKIHEMITKKEPKPPKSEYKGTLGSNASDIAEYISRNLRVGKAVKLIIDSSLLDKVEKSYSNYGARQLYYHIDKEEGLLSYVAICGSLLELQLYISGEKDIEDREKLEEIEEINNINSRTLSLDRRRDDGGHKKSYKIRLTPSPRPRDNGAGSMDEEGDFDSDGEPDGPDSDRLPEYVSNGDILFAVRTGERIKEVKTIHNTKFVHNGEFWINADRWVKGVRT